MNELCGSWRLLRLAGFIPLVAFGFSCGACIHAVTLAAIIPSAGHDQADHNDRQKKEYPPSIDHFEHRWV
jgi:hypothetical protein